MINKIGFLILFLILSKNVQSQNIDVVKLDEIEKILNSPSDTTYVLNFWASWCGPCVKELPVFDKIGQEYSKQKVKVIFVNLDKLDKLETKVKPLLRKNSVKSEAWLLDEADPNYYIDRIDPDWSGALPFTIILNKEKNKKNSVESSLSEEELIHQINEVKN